MTKKLALIMVAVVVIATGQYGAPGVAPQLDVVMQEIKPGLFIATGPGGHTVVRVTPGGVIVVDTKNPGDPVYNGLMAEIKKVTDKPVKYVVVTHHHLDHSGNVGKFIDTGVQVIGHDNLKINLGAHTPRYAPGRGLRPPNVTYEKDKTIELGGVRVEVHHYARAHTSGDSIVYFPDLKVVVPGDCVVGTAPAMDFQFGASAVEWQTVLAEIEKLDFDMLIPGHSGDLNPVVFTRDDFMKFKTKFDTLMSRARDLVKSGTPKELFVSRLKVDDLGWYVLRQQLMNPDRLDPFYAELQSGTANPLP
jgi:glyoxylase-like metal-dependent hydrolase (beta-lactamase superfamily II)